MQHSLTPISAHREGGKDGILTLQTPTWLDKDFTKAFNVYVNIIKSLKPIAQKLELWAQSWTLLTKFEVFVRLLSCLANGCSGSCGGTDIKLGEGRHHVGGEQTSCRGTDLM